MQVPDRRDRVRAAAVSSVVALATLGLYVLSRGKWSDPIIDSGREWIVPDALARGDLLYRDVVYWFGPFTPYFHAMFFRLFGSGLRTLVSAGIVGAAGVLGCLHLALLRVTGRREAWGWTVLAVPALVFMPNAGGAILGMGYRMWHAAGFGLLAVSLASGRVPRRQAFRSAGAGLCAALAGLCRTEWGLATLASVLLAAFLRRRRGNFFLEALLLVASALLPFGAVVLFFVALGGAQTILYDAPVLLVGIPVETRASAGISGFSGWRTGFPLLFYSATQWLVVFLLAQVVALYPLEGRRIVQRLRPLGAVLLFLLLLAALGGASGALLFSAAPLVCLVSLVAGFRRQRGPRAAALASFGLLGLLLFHRRLFHIGDAGYVAPPLLFAFVSAAGLLRLASRFRASVEIRSRLGTAFRGCVALLTVVAYVGRALQYASDDRVPIPGTDKMLSASPSFAREISRLAGEIRGKTASVDGLVVFPEGEIFNLLSGRANPIRHKLFLPGYVTENNEGGILAELSEARPSAIVIWRRVTAEYGRGLFGEDYGRRIRGWINENYEIEGAGPVRYPQFVFFLRRSRATPAPREGR